LDKKILSLLIFGVCLPTISFALAMLTPQNTPKILGYFTVELKVENAFNVYGWQAVVEFDPQKIMIIDVTPGDFLDASSTNETSVNISDHGYRVANKSFFVYHIRDQTKLIIAQTLLGEEDGKSGDGTLAYIKFGYLTEDYQNAFHLIFNDSIYKTQLVNNNLLPTNGQIVIG